MKIKGYKMLLNEARIPYLKKEKEFNVDGRVVFNSPSKLADLIKEIGIQDCAEEYVYVICLNVKLQIVGIFEVSHGTNSASFISSREIYQRALMCGASGICVTHNHPSGDVTPSKEDVNATRKLVEAGNILGIQLIDHIVVGESYFSFKEGGLL